MAPSALLSEIIKCLKNLRNRE